MPNPPMNDWICPECGAVFRAKDTFHADGRRGKTCPAGHWSSVAAIRSHTKSVGTPQTEAEEVRKRLARMGLGERNDQLTVALRWMLDGYDRALASLPEKSIARGVVDGAFGKLPAMAREVLG